MFLDDYKKAQQKANKAKNTNDLSSNNDDVLRKKHRRKRNKRTSHYRRTDSESESESSESVISSIDDVTYPDIPNKETEANNSK